MTPAFNPSPDNTKLVTISKDRRAVVWDVKKGKKHAEMGWDAPTELSTPTSASGKDSG